MAKFERFMLGLILGAITGAGAALLLAPYSGTQMRSEINIYFKKATEDIKTAAAQKRVELEKQLDALRAPKEIETTEKI